MANNSCCILLLITECSDDEEGVGWFLKLYQCNEVLSEVHTAVRDSFHYLVSICFQNYKDFLATSLFSKLQLQLCGRMHGLLGKTKTLQLDERDTISKNNKTAGKL